MWDDNRAVQLGLWDEAPMSCDSCPEIQGVEDCFFCGRVLCEHHMKQHDCHVKALMLDGR